MRRFAAIALATVCIAGLSGNGHAFELTNDVRWFEPDAGQPVRFSIAGHAGAAERGAVVAAMAAWNAVDCSSLVLELVDDSHNVIAFDDPYDGIADPVNCGGVLAVTGPSIGSATRVVNDTTFRQIVDADITLPNGWAECSYWTESNLAELLTHLLGRSIGVAQSPYLQFDGRGATLTPEDQAALCAVYPAGFTAPLPVPAGGGAPGDRPLVVRTLRVRPSRTTLIARFVGPVDATQPVTLAIGAFELTVPPEAWTQRAHTLTFKDVTTKLTIRSHRSVSQTLTFVKKGVVIAPDAPVTLRIGDQRYVGER